MHIAFIEPEAPNTEHSTVTYGAMLLVEALRAAGHQVSLVLPLAERTMIASEETQERWIAALRESGISTHVVKATAMQPKSRLPWRVQQVRRIVQPRIEDYFPQTAMGPRMAALLEHIRPDALFLWMGYEAVAMTDGVRTAPRFASPANTSPTGCTTASPRKTR